MRRGGEIDIAFSIQDATALVLWLRAFCIPALKEWPDTLMALGHSAKSAQHIAEFSDKLEKKRKRKRQSNVVSLNVPIAQRHALGFLLQLVALGRLSVPAAPPALIREAKRLTQLRKRGRPKVEDEERRAKYAQLSKCSPDYKHADEQTRTRLRNEAALRRSERLDAWFERLRSGGETIIGASPEMLSELDRIETHRPHRGRPKKNRPN